VKSHLKRQKEVIIISLLSIVIIIVWYINQLQLRLTLKATVFPDIYCWGTALYFDSIVAFTVI